VVAISHGARAPEFCTQDGHAYRFDWGIEGLEALAPSSAVVVVVDVLRFTTAVCCALESGGTVLPYPWSDDGVGEFAARHDAVVAGRREDGAPSLSPTDLLVMPPMRLVLPSPNGSALSVTARALGARHVLAASLRNATAVARAARQLAANEAITIIAAGERWGDATGPLRPAVEDMIGAGAVLAALDPSNARSQPRSSPEASAARAVFLSARPLLFDALLSSASGRELAARGWDDDVATAAAYDVTDVIPILDGSEYRPL